MTLGQLILDLPHRAAHGAEDFLVSDVVTGGLLGLRQHSSPPMPRIPTPRIFLLSASTSTFMKPCRARARDRIDLVT